MVSRGASGLGSSVRATGVSVLGFAENPVIAFGLPAHTFLRRIAGGSTGMVGSTITSFGKLQKVCATKCRLELAVSRSSKSRASLKEFMLWQFLNLTRKLIHFGLALLQFILQLIFFRSTERERESPQADFSQCIHFLRRSITIFSKKTRSRLFTSAWIEACSYREASYSRLL